jgi:hypothetical protein
VQRSASTLHLAMREEFMTNVMKRLVGEPDNFAVKAVVNLCLDAVPTFFCDEPKPQRSLVGLRQRFVCGTHRGLAPAG